MAKCFCGQNIKTSEDTMHRGCRFKSQFQDIPGAVQKKDGLLFIDVKIVGQYLLDRQVKEQNKLKTIKRLETTKKNKKVMRGKKHGIPKHII